MNICQLCFDVGGMSDVIRCNIVFYGIFRTQSKPQAYHIKILCCSYFKPKGLPATRRFLVAYHTDVLTILKYRHTYA